MNAITIVIASICILAIAYRLYGTFMMVKVLKINDQTPTPAHVLEDGKDYVPTNKWVSFGHHFAAIAAAGPLVGPILAAQFGYLPGLLWLLIGAVIGEPCTILSYCLHQCGKTGKRFLKSLKKSSARWRAFAPVFRCCLSLRSRWRGCPWLCFMRLRKPVGNVCGGDYDSDRDGVGLYYKNGQSQTRINSRVSFVNGRCCNRAAAADNGSRGHADTGCENACSGASRLCVFAAALPVWLLLAPRDYLSSFMKIGVLPL